MKAKKPHLETAAAYIAVAESGDSKRTAYEKAADEILAALKEEEVKSQAEAARDLGKSKTWISELLNWRVRHAERSTPWAAIEDDHRYRSAERKVPTRHEDRVEMAEKLLADPAVEREIRAREVEQREHKREEAHRRLEAQAIPLPAAYAAIVGKLNAFSLALADLHDSVHEIQDGDGRRQLTIALNELVRQAQRWIEVLESSVEERAA